MNHGLINNNVFFLDQRKQAKMQWVQDPSRSIVDNLSNVRPDISRHCRNKKKEYLKSKMEEHETNSKIKSSRNLYGASVIVTKVTTLERI